jgi:hypothetical protein
MRLPELTTEQAAAIRERDRRSDFEAAAVEAFNGEMPGATAKQRLDALLALKNKTADELLALQAKRASMQGLLDAPATVAAKRTSLLHVLARRLLGGEEIVDHDEQAALDSELRASKRKAAVAEVALAELDVEIDKKQLQVRRLGEREAGFAKDALKEYVSAELGPQYHAAVTELRRVIQRIDGAREAAGHGGFALIELPTLGVLKRADAMIAPDIAATAPWRKLLSLWGVEQRKPSW